MTERDGELSPTRGAHHVQSLARGLSVIRAFDADRPRLTLSEVAERTGLTRAAARRFLLTLVDLGYVHTDGSRFALTPRVLELGYSYLSSLTLPELAEPHLERLSAQVRESSSVAVLDADHIVYVARVATSRIMAVTITVGTRLPAHATSMGRVLLADLDEDELLARLGHGPLTTYTDRTISDLNALREELATVRKKGYALVDQELETGLRSIAAPITDRHGHALAAVNVSAHASRTSLEQLRNELAPAVRSTAAAISADLGALGSEVAPPAR